MKSVHLESLRTFWRGTARSFNQNNQETTGGPLAFSYDGAGNATRWSAKRMVSTPSPTQGAPNIVSEEPNALAMSYTAQGQMAQVNTLESDGSAGALKQKNGYRGDGLRAWKEDASGHRTYFFYSGTTLTGMVGEDAGGTLSPPRQLLWGADGLLGIRWREANGDERASYFLWDTQGNLALSYNETGQLSRSFGFTAYGSPLPDAGGEFAEATFGYGGKFGYLRDGETNLVICTWRFYDPSLGTWTQRDPIGYEGGANLYGYVNGDPSNFVDPLGLAQFGIKPFETNLALGTGPNYGNLKLAHEHIFFNDGSAAGFGSNGPWIGNALGQSYTGEEKNIPNYMFDNIHYDDHILKKAVGNVGYRFRYNVFNMRKSINCQTWAFYVRREYFRLGGNVWRAPTKFPSFRPEMYKKARELGSKIGEIAEQFQKWSGM